MGNTVSELYREKTAFKLTFEASTILVDEPQGWDAVKFVIKRDKKTHGVTAEFSDGETSVGFDNSTGDTGQYVKAKDFIDSAFNLRGSDAEIIFTFEVNDVIFYEGRIDLTGYKANEHTVDCTIQRESFGNKVKNRWGNKTQLDITKSIEDVTIDPITEEVMLTHSLDVFKTLLNLKDADDISYNTGFRNNLAYDGGGDLDTWTSFWGWQLGVLGEDIVNDVNEFFNVGTAYFDANTYLQDSSPFYVPTFENPYLKLSPKIDFRVQLEVQKDDTGLPDSEPVTMFYASPLTVLMGLYRRRGIVITTLWEEEVITEASDIFGVPAIDFFNSVKNHTMSATKDFSLNLGSFGGGSIELNNDVDADDEFFTASKITFVHEGREPGVGGGELYYQTDIKVLECSRYELELTDFFNEKNVKVYSAFNVGDSIVRRITDENALKYKSDFLQNTTNFKPYLTTGTAIRGNTAELIPNECIFVDVPGGAVEIEKVPETSFKEFHESFDAMFSMGLGFEKDISDNDIVRHERASYFYSNNQILELTDVTEYNESFSEDHSANELLFGFKKVVTEIQGTNVRDEFNTSQDRNIPISSLSKKVVKQCKYNAAGVAIEYQRRFNDSETNTTDAKFDEDIFIVLGRFDGVLKSETNQFSDMEGVFNSDTSYNIRLNPLSSAINNAPIWASALFWKEGTQQNIIGKYTGNGEAIAKAGIETPNFEGVNQDSLRMIDNIPVSLIKDLALFQPITIEFSVILTLDQLNLIRDNHTGYNPQNGYIAVQSPSGAIVKGFLLSLKWSPVTLLCDITLIKKYAQ